LAIKSLLTDLITHGKVHPDIVANYALIDITGPSTQFHATYPSGKSFTVDKSFPNVAPPFCRMLMEFWCPPGLTGGYGRVAVFIAAMPPDEIRLPPNLTEKPRWQLLFTVVAEFQKEVVKFPLWPILFVYADGKLAENDPEGQQWIYAFDEMPDVAWPYSLRRFRSISAGQSNEECSAYMLDWFVAPCLFAISLLHCKNVALVKAPAPALKEDQTATHRDAYFGAPHHRDSRSARKRRRCPETGEWHPPTPAHCSRTLQHLHGGSASFRPI